MDFREEQNAFWRTALRDEFVKRCQNNAAYSLRAFAKALDLDQSLLTKILNSQRNVSPKVIDKVSERLGVPPYFKEDLIKNLKLNKYNFIEDQDFDLIDHWYYFAILELFKTKNFEGSAVYISKRLNLHKQEVQAALDILTQHGFLNKKQNTFTLSKRNNSWANTKATTAKKTKLQKELVKKALVALDEVPFEKRDNSSLTLAVNSKKLPALKDKITQMRRELDTFVQCNEKEKTDYDEVYQVVISLYPLTLNSTKNQKQEKTNDKN